MNQPFLIHTIKAWQCIGCGKIEAPQQCVGICQDRKVEMVSLHDHQAVLAAQLRHVEDAMAVLRQIAFTTPHSGESARAWSAIQKRARQVLKTDEDDQSVAPVAAAGLVKSG